MEEFNYNQGFQKQQADKILKSYGVDIEKGGKAATIGEIRTWNGKKYKKQVNGKWLEVSEDNELTKKEHEYQSNYSKEMSQKPSLHTAYHESSMNGHAKEASKLSDKEHSDEEVGLDSKSDKKEGKNDSDNDAKLFEKIYEKINSEELKQFPATRNRLTQIATSIRRGDKLNESDLQTLEMNKIDHKSKEDNKKEDKELTLVSDIKKQLKDLVSKMTDEELIDKQSKHNNGEIMDLERHMLANDALDEEMKSRGLEPKKDDKKPKEEKKDKTVNAKEASKLSDKEHSGEEAELSGKTVHETKESTKDLESYSKHLTAQGIEHYVSGFGGGRIYVNKKDYDEKIKPGIYKDSRSLTEHSSSHTHGTGFGIEGSEESLSGIKEKEARYDSKRKLQSDLKKENNNKEVSKETMTQQRKYTEEVLSYLKEKHNHKPTFVDRITNGYRIKLSEKVAGEIEAKFPGVKAKSMGYGKLDFGIVIPFEKPKVDKKEDSKPKEEKKEDKEQDLSKVDKNTLKRMIDILSKDYHGLSQDDRKTLHSLQLEYGMRD